MKRIILAFVAVALLASSASAGGFGLLSRVFGGPRVVVAAPAPVHVQAPFVRVVGGGHNGFSNADFRALQRAQYNNNAALAAALAQQQYEAELLAAQIRASQRQYNSVSSFQFQQSYGGNVRNFRGNGGNCGAYLGGW